MKNHNFAQMLYNNRADWVAISFLIYLQFAIALLTCILFDEDPKMLL